MDEDDLEGEMVGEDPLYTEADAIKLGLKEAVRRLEEESERIRYTLPDNVLGLKWAVRYLRSLADDTKEGHGA